MAQGYYIGIEASSRTVALLADPDGKIVGKGTAGPSTYSVVGSERCSQMLWTAIIAAFGAAGINTRDLLRSEQPLPDVAAIGLGMPGIEKPKDQATIRRVLDDFNLTQNLVVTSEAKIVLEAGTPDSWGVAVLAGDSALAYGQGRDGGSARAGGWGYLLGEEGSSYAIGLEAVKAVLAAADGRGPETLLTDWIHTDWKIASGRTDLVAKKVYTLIAGLGSGGNKAQLENTVESYQREIAAFAPAVERFAAKGDAASQAILDRAAQSLAECAQAAIRQADVAAPAAPSDLRGLRQRFEAMRDSNPTELVPLALAGATLLTSTGELRQRLLDRLPNCAPPQLVTDPAEGALKLARNFQRKDAKTLRDAKDL